MEHATIAALLEKYWHAETTVEEEQLLAEYFRQPDVAPEWEPLRDIFAYFGQEATLVPSAALETKILEHIREMEAPVRTLRRVKWSYAAAAAVILGIGLFLAAPQHRGDRGGDTPVSTAPGNIKDTYDDPQQALAAIQKALLTVSTRMNKGKKITERQMDRLNDSWQAAITN